MNKIRALLSIAALFFIGCKSENIEKDNSVILFTDLYRSRMVIAGNHLCKPEELKDKTNAMLHDQATHKNWFYYIVGGKSYFQSLNSDGTLSDPIIISYKDVEPAHGKEFINNNIALIPEKSKHFVVIDGVQVGINGEQYEMLYVNLIDKSYLELSLLSEDGSITGFSGGFIFGKNWSYDIKTKTKKVFTKKLQYISYMAEIDRLAGIDEEGNTVLVDYRTDTYETLPIKKRKLYSDRFYYNQGDLFYINNDYIYYSEYSKCYPVAFHFTFFQKALEPRKWYRYNRATGENVQITTPTEICKVVGVLK
ncbi:MAG: hypothetical protein J6K96_00520 [Treponema sp.]|nr:hypothetical protein [Treponema sp.]